MALYEPTFTMVSMSWLDELEQYAAPTLLSATTNKPNSKTKTVDGIEYHRCWSCKKWLEMTEFYKRKPQGAMLNTRKTTYQCHCISCCKLISKKQKRVKK